MTMPLGEGLIPTPRGIEHDTTPLLAQFALQIQMRNLMLTIGTQAAEQQMLGGVAIETNPDFVASKHAYDRVEGDLDRMARSNPDIRPSEDIIL